MHIHPPLSGLPLAGILLLVAIEVGRSFRRIRDVVDRSRAVVVAALIFGVLCSFLSGYHASSNLAELSPTVESAIATHHSAGRFLLINVLLLGTFFFLSTIAVHGRRVIESLYYVFLLSQVVLTVWVGHIGGDLVFDHGVGTSREALER